MRRFLATLGLLWALAAGPASGQMSVLWGHAPSHAGDELVFYQYSDMITHTEEPVGRCVVDAQGHFLCSLKVDRTAFVFCTLGVYRGYLYIEPGSHYELVLPEKLAKTEAQRLNPFFRYTDLHLGIRGLPPTDLNRQIHSFGLAFNQHFDRIVRDAFEGRREIDLDSLIVTLEEAFGGFTNPFFRAYREYRYGLLKQLSMMRQSRATSDEFFLNRPVLYNNPAYMELFNLVYHRYLLFFSRTQKGSAVFTNISEERSYTRLRETLAQDYVLGNDTLLEMVILKGLYDGFFDDEFSRSALLAILDSIYSTTTIAEHLVIAQNIRTRVTRLLPGFAPTPFSLYSADGRLVTLDDFEGRYVYLNFCTTTSYTCLQEFSLLESLRQRFGQFLDIVTISVDSNPQDLKDFLAQSGYSWTFLHYGNAPHIVRDFDVRAYPTYFLIGPDQLLILSPAPSPREDFVKQLFRVLRSRGKI